MITRMHMGRHWVGHDIEDRCPCPQEPCGLIDPANRHVDCVQHLSSRTFRQDHPADRCPGRPYPACPASISGFCLKERESATACTAEDRECVHDGRVMTP